MVLESEIYKIKDTILTLRLACAWSLLLLVRRLIVNVDPTLSYDFTEINPPRCDMIRWQMLSPIPFPYPFLAKLYSFVDLK